MAASIITTVEHTMTPQEIFDYKTRWLTAGGYSVSIHSDLDVAGKDWCRRFLERHQWSFQSYTDIYEHTFWFEHQRTSQEFAQEFYDWVKK
jgi:hypothetical protein